MASPFNQRWIPPTPATKQPVSSSPQPTSAPPSHGKKKEKAQQKRVAEEQNVEKHVPSETVEKAAVEEVADSPQSAKKPKKRKRESNAQEDGDEATPKKHKNIFSKFEKVSKRAQEQSDKPNGGAEVEEEQEPEVLRDLEPLPQPAPVPDPVFEPTFSVLPSWLAEPIAVEASKRVPFSDLDVQPHFQKKLEKQGFTDALAVQAALLPMLHPGHQQYQGDICVSAKTGSGKTLAYLLPIIEALKERTTHVLSAIIVVPSRQLVDQALQTAQELCAGTKIRVGTALGSTPFASEQKQLVNMRAVYDPRRAEQLHDMVAEQLESGFREGGIVEDFAAMPTKDHVPRYDSRVDILICTPGRLVEHLESTTSLLLQSVRWLVIDEADQLLGQNFQGWATALMDLLHSETSNDLMDVQEEFRKKPMASSFRARRELTKIVLSATMETDLTKLGTLRLKRPTLVSIVEEPGHDKAIAIDGDNFELPSTLDESAIPVGGGSKKPLYLLYTLLNHIFPGAQVQQDVDPVTVAGHKPISEHTNRVLVFTKSNESASRLAHLLSVLEPSLKTYLKNMTPSSTSKAAKQLLRAFSTGAIKILIASDAASRGLDIPDITHVVNYDVPTSITSYVHRVGRTARAGKDGEAWTLFTKSEAAWFWKKVAREEGGVRRNGKKVKRVELKERDVTWDRKRTYEAALAELQDAVAGAQAE